MNLKSLLVWSLVPLFWISIIVLFGVSKSVLIFSGIVLSLLTVVVYGLTGIGKSLDEWEQNSIEE